nr:MFS transporter [Paenibacillus roseus]
MWSGRFLTSLGLTGISPFIPYYMETLQAGGPEAVLFWTGLSLSAPALSYAICTPLWGKLGDRWSRKWMVARALLGLALSMLLMAVAQTPFQFFLFRLCQGAFGGISDASSAFVGTHARPKEQGLALGRLERASALGLLLGPLLGGLYVNTWGSRSLLLTTAALTGILALYAAFALTGTKKARPLATNDKRKGILPTFVELLNQSAVRRFLVAGILFKLVDFSTFAIFAPYIAGQLHSPANAAATVGLLLAISSLGELIGAPWWGKRNDHKRLERNVIIASLLCSVFLIAHFAPFGLVWLICIRFLLGFCYSALLQTVMLSVLRSSSDENRGVRVGATNSLLMVGQLSGPSIGVFIGAQLGMSTVFLVMGGVMVIAALVIARLPGLTRLRKTKLPVH